MESRSAIEAILANNFELFDQFNWSVDDTIDNIDISFKVIEDIFCGDWSTFNWINQRVTNKRLFQNELYVYSIFEEYWNVAKQISSFGNINHNDAIDDIRNFVESDENYSRAMDFVNEDLAATAICKLQKEVIVF
jgi:hypothetical protein